MRTGYIDSLSVKLRFVPLVHRNATFPSNQLAMLNKQHTVSRPGRVPWTPKQISLVYASFCVHGPRESRAAVKGRHTTKSILLKGCLKFPYTFQVIYALYVSRVRESSFTTACHELKVLFSMSPSERYIRSKSPHF